MKTKISDLAIFGGQPLFTSTVHVGRPNIGDRQILLERINRILDDRWFSNNGPCVQEFENRIAGFLGVKHCIAMCNGTVALEIAIRALEMKGEVIVPSLTFIATAHALQWQEITPVFCDIESCSCNIDPESVEKMITPRTTGIIGVHLWGRPCDIASLTRLARRHGLKLLFDAAHAFSCTYNGHMIGNFGDAEVLSFHATKFVNTFEGGAVVTNNDDLAKKIRLMKNFGFSGYDNVIYIGTNGKMSEISAAMGLTSLDSLDEFISVNRRNYETYEQRLEDMPGIELIKYDEGQNPNYQYVIVKVDKEEAPLSRDDIVKTMHAENVLVRRYFYPGCHAMEPYRSYFPHAGLLLPNTETVLSQVLSLPTGTSVGIEDIDRICDMIQFIMHNAREIASRLAYGQQSN
ncbi:MAG TPA: aminotransferase class I/II-fold pyridoxal phosphate-dependent enzyme [Deltaproteobacteria bacterium]|nr:aminotransferase class I/II-fold pyridoxal phosphate-dependent enzyme [Deltaproteobacteria bacterium]HNY66854.1 aminotransferase class I/II-fold pyridoxal phosphate-dependent enzyme [Deltaproteobacteria bacterium]